MWTQIERNLAGFPSAVLSVVDAAGFPASVRCHTQLDGAAHRLRLSDLPGLVRPGPACLLFHRHDERLWNLKSFVLRGSLEQDEQGWFLSPQQFIPGMGVGGLPGYVRLLRKARRQTKQYLAKRNLSRPQVSWQALVAFMKGDEAGE